MFYSLLHAVIYFSYLKLLFKMSGLFKLPHTRRIAIHLFINT